MDDAGYSPARSGFISKKRSWLLFIIPFLICSPKGFAAFSLPNRTSPKHSRFDTVFVKKGTHFLLFGRIGIIRNDTFFIVTDTMLHYKNKNRPSQSSFLYDSIYSKLSRNKISKLLYPLAFRPPQPPPLLDKIQVIRDESPFQPYCGKIIRKVRIRSLKPFGTSVQDTTSVPVTGLGRALNNTHLNTHTDVIRKNLLIREGQILDPDLLADNEKILRELPFIDKVQTYVTVVGEDQDSVDITIVTKDVWSIGFDLTTISTDNLIVHLYDANFLGRGDMLGTHMSFHLNRAPFFRFDEVSYHLTNIAGSFIDGSVGYSADDEGNENFIAGLQRPFFSNKTKWAGGGYFQYLKTIRESPNELNEFPVYSNDMNLWAGRSFLLNKKENNPRLIVMESFYRRKFTSRPVVTIDTNLIYYDRSMILTGIALSRNNNYLSDYIFQFGKTENIPYGSLFQVTFGPEIGEFYNRIYGGCEISLGNFYRRFGYISGDLRFGGYLNNHGSLEDAVVKFGTKYMTPLIRFSQRNYRFRSFLTADYKYGFNFRTNNNFYSTLSQNVQLSHDLTDSIFMGVHSVAVKLENLLYTPWYFYGFKFGLLGYFQGGIVAAKGESLMKNPFYSAVGIGVLIKNDNLIFPTLLITAYIYPSFNHAVPYFQFTFINDIGFQFPEFNPSGTRVENLRN
jgi:hypothetical protein